MKVLEPWCDNIYVDQALIADYIKQEQPNTDLILEARVRSIEEPKQTDVIVYFDATKQIDFSVIQNMHAILKESLTEVGTYEYGNFKIDVVDDRDYTENLMGTFVKNVF